MSRGVRMNAITIDELCKEILGIYRKYEDKNEIVELMVQ